MIDLIKMLDNSNESELQKKLEQAEARLNKHSRKVRKT